MTAASATNGTSSSSARVLTPLHLKFGVECKPGTDAALSINFDSAAPSGWSVSGLTHTDAPTYGLKVNGKSGVGQSGSWGFGKAVDGLNGNYVRLSMGYATDTATGYRLQGSLLVTRGSHSATVEFALDDFASDACSARAQVTPSS